MKSDIHKLSVPAMPLGSPFPPRHRSLCPKEATIDHNDQYKLVDKRRRFRAGEILARQDETADMLFVIYERYCKSSVKRGDNVFTSHFYVPEDIMTLDAVEGGKYLATTKATTVTGICHIDVARLFRVADKEPSVTAAAIKFLCRDNGFIVEGLQHYANKHAEARAAAFLMEFYEMHLRIGRPKTTLYLPFSRDEIASCLDLEIETVSRSLKSPERQNPITLHRVCIVAINSHLGLKRFI